MRNLFRNKCCCIRQASYDDDLAFNCVPYFHVLATCCVTCSSFQAQDVRLESTLRNPSQICCAKSKRNNPCKYVVLLHLAKLSPLKKYQGQRPLRSSHLSRKKGALLEEPWKHSPFLHRDPQITTHKHTSETSLRIVL